MDGRGVLVTEFVSGSPARGDFETLTALGDVLGRLHSMPCDSGAAGREAGSLHHWSPWGGLPSADIAEALSWLAQAEANVAADQRPAFEAFRDAVAAADPCDDLPRALIHPDYHLGNVIATADGRLVLVDWTGAGRGPRIISLALFLGLSVRRNPGGPGLGAIIAGYRRHVRLEPEELARLAGAIRKPRLIFEAFMLSRRRGTPDDLAAGLAAAARQDEGIAARARAAFDA
jgi:Ser/Thr protein kinase RdoA (MazF antagonist)